MTCERNIVMIRTCTDAMKNKSVFSFLRTLTMWHCLHLPAARRAAVRRAAINRYLLSAGPAAANLQQRVCCCGPVLRQTDGRVDRQTGGRAQQMHKPCSTCGQCQANGIITEIIQGATEKKTTHTAICYPKTSLTQTQ